MQRRMLSKEDEVTSGGEDIQVRREDQDKINRFSRLHQKETKLKEKEDLEEVSTELELADDDVKIPYKIGDSFVSLPPAEALELLAASNEKIETSVTKLEDTLSTLRDEKDELKVDLYARFGKSINLET
ncbi:prefoldin subunit 4 [Viridothelium virens]|uniref:Prefoldin subunit 4 n=1 Tax=Viridothelium virens TaxID=1048519 RepID=A0A6A6H0Q3_VIRVR|nr:prefoldin subunit 4 [Viridothelium virens]